MTNTPMFQVEIQVSFGHCDAAGIVFYPNFFRWFDRCFHTYLLHHHAGHAAVCQKLGARGIGLMKVDASFRSPALDGDVLILEMVVADWHERSVRLNYTGRVDGRVVVQGEELRGVFVPDGARIKAAPVAALRAMIEGDGHV